MVFFMSAGFQNLCFTWHGSRVHIWKITISKIRWQWSAARSQLQNAVSPNRTQAYFARILAAKVADQTHASYWITFSQVNREGHHWGEFEYGAAFELSPNLPRVPNRPAAVLIACNRPFQNSHGIFLCRKDFYQHVPIVANSGQCFKCKCDIISIFAKMHCEL